MVEVNKDRIMMAILKEYPSDEDRQLVAIYLRSIGGCPHLNKITAKESFDGNLCRIYDTCLDCGEENV